MFYTLSILITLLLPRTLLAADPTQGLERTEMEGYSLNDFLGFETKWKLVTARFRKDTGEMRFIYANPLAWTALKSHQTDYPDGAILGKIGLATQEDPAFTSSLVPSGTRRYQFMVRNKAKHAETDGWAYVLFNSEGRTYPEDPKVQVRACAACHRLVPDRGFVFAEIMHLSPFFGSKTSQKSDWRKLNFVTRKKNNLPSWVRALLPAHEMKIRVLEGELRKSLFQGTLDEIRPVLIQETLSSGLPSTLISEDGTRFTIVFKDKSNENCPNATGLLSITSNPPSEKSGTKKIQICQSSK